MAVADLIPQMNDAELSSLHENARRIEASASGAKKEQAAQLRPLIEAELVRREGARPVKTPAKRVVKAKPRAAAKKTA
jgi:hypothetical protein